MTCNTDEGKCVAIGMDESTLVEDSEGKVYFNGATVRMETTDATPSVRAKEVYIKDDSSTHLSVSYRENNKMITVVKANRLNTIKSEEKTYVEVKSCTHENISYVSLGSEQHHASCESCGVNYDEAHIIGEPAVWNWADDHSEATAVFPCPCGYNLNIQTNSIEVKDYLHKNVYTANVEYSGKTYTNTVEVYKSDIVITNESDWGNFVQTVNDGTTFAGQTITLTNNISVTTMAGTDTHKFMGTFEGGGHTITFNYTADEDRAAPFRYVDGATFKNLKVTGTITTSKKNAAVCWVGLTIKPFLSPTV